MSIKEKKWEDGTLTRYYYSEGESPKLLKLEDFSAENILIMSVDYAYDEKGNNTERIARSGSGDLLFRLVFGLNSDGLEIVQEEYNAQNALTSTKQSKYLDAYTREITTTDVNGIKNIEIEPIQ